MKQITEIMNTISFDNAPLKVKSIRNILKREGLNVNKNTVIWYLNKHSDEYELVKPYKIGSNKYFINLWVRKGSQWDTKYNNDKISDFPITDEILTM